MPSQLHTCRKFTGKNLHSPPQDLAEGEMTLCDNLRVDGGELVLRPGRAGQLSAPFGSPLYAPLPYLTANADGAQTGTTVLFTTAGRIYQWAKGGAAAAEIVPSGIAAGSVRSATARWARLGHYAYLTDGQAAQPLVRVDLAGAGTATALTPPATAPGAVLTSTTVDSFSDPTAWQVDTLTTAASNQIVNGNFVGGTGGGGPNAATAEPGWTAIGQTIDWHNNAGPGSNGVPGGYAGTWLLCDTPGDLIITTAGIANFAETLDAARNATQFYLAYQAINTDAQARGSVVATVIAFDAGGNELSRITKETQIPNTGGQAKVYEALYSFGDLGTPIATYKVQILNGLNNQLGISSVYLTGVVSYPTVPQIRLTGGTGGLLITTAFAVAGVNEMYLSGTHLRHTFAAVQDLSGSNVLDPVLGPDAQTISGLSFKLRLQQSGTGLWYDTNPVTISAGLASVDITTVPLAVRQACSALEIVFLADVSFTALPQLMIGPLNAAGDLSVVNLGGLGGAAPVTYVFTEVNAGTDPVALANVIESDPSPVSLALSPTVTQARALVTLPAAINAGTTHFRVYRTGGVFSDGVGRLIGTLPVGADAITGGDGALVSWTHGTRVLSDNTPDSFLQASATVFLTTGRLAPPPGAQAICAWQGRIWLAVKGKLYASWAVTQDQQAALYFNRVNSQYDPLNAVKGITFSVGQDDNDPIIALVPLGTNQFFTKGYLVVLKQHSIWLVSGTDPTNFSIQSFLIGSGIGSAAANAACVVDGNMKFLSVAGVREFDGDKPGDMSLKIEDELHPLSGTPMNPAALAGALMVYHDRRIHLFAPLPGDNANTVCHIWDSRQQEWTRELNPVTVTGACSLSSQTDNGDLVIMGSDGQIYLQTPGAFVDKHLPTDAGTPIAWAVKARGTGEEGDDMSFWRQNKPLRLFVQATTQEVIAATATLDNEAGNVFTTAYSLTGLDGPEVRVPSSASGTYHIPGLSGSASTFTRIKSLAVESVEARFTR